MIANKIVIIRDGATVQGTILEGFYYNFYFGKRDSFQRDLVLLKLETGKQPVEIESFTGAFLDKATGMILVFEGTDSNNVRCTIKIYVVDRS